MTIEHLRTIVGSPLEHPSPLKAGDLLARAVDIIKVGRLTVLSKPDVRGIVAGNVIRGTTIGTCS